MFGSTQWRTAVAAYLEEAITTQNKMPITADSITVQQFRALGACGSGIRFFDANMTEVGIKIKPDTRLSLAEAIVGGKEQISWFYNKISTVRGLNEENVNKVRLEVARIFGAAIVACGSEGSPQVSRRLKDLINMAANPLVNITDLGKAMKAIREDNPTPLENEVVNIYMHRNDHWISHALSFVQEATSMPYAQRLPFIYRLTMWITNRKIPAPEVDITGDTVLLLGQQRYMLTLDAAGNPTITKTEYPAPVGGERFKLGDDIYVIREGGEAAVELNTGRSVTLVGGAPEGAVLGVTFLRQE